MDARESQGRGATQIATVSGRHGVVTSGHALATEAGLDVLRKGGNAVDAAVAAAFVLSVVCPYACTLAGDVYLLIRTPDGAVTGVNGTGCAPRAATLERYREGAPRAGIESVTVPGFVAGLADTLARHGTWDWASVVRPAEKLARDGFAIHPYFAKNIRNRMELLEQDSETRRVFLPGGAPLEPGAHFRQPELADCLGVLASDGAESIYRGKLAEKLCLAGAERGWILSADDLAEHETLFQKPINAPFYGHDVWTMPPNSFGGTLLLQLLTLEASGVAKIDPDSAGFIWLGVAARAAAYKTAARLIADPRATEDTFRALLAKAIAQGVESLSRTANAPPELRDRCTTNVCVIDKGGMAVSLIQSISAPWGAGVMLPGTGILLNNRLAGFNANPESANCIAPRKRPAHTLAPCLVTKGESLAMTIGTPGTIGQTCVLAQYLARTLACGQDVAVAADRPRWSVDFAGKPIVEATMDAALKTETTVLLPELRAMPSGWISFGSIKMARAEGGTCLALADHRRSAMAGAVAGDSISPLH